MEEAHQVNSIIQKLLLDFKVLDNQVVMPKEVLSKWLENLKQYSPDKQRYLADELVAVALQFQEKAGEAAFKAIVQLAFLASIALGAKIDAQKMLNYTGIDLKKAAEFIGIAPLTEHADNADSNKDSMSWLEFMKMK